MFNQNNQTIEISDLENHEIFIGEDIAEDLFAEDDNPIGKNITIQTTVFSFAPFGTNITSVAIPISFNFTIVDIFIDQGLGEELYTNFIISPLHVVQ